jgi:hypothetical protein
MMMRIAISSDLGHGGLAVRDRRYQDPECYIIVCSFWYLIASSDDIDVGQLTFSRGYPEDLTSEHCG